MPESQSTVSSLRREVDDLLAGEFSHALRFFERSARRHKTEPDDVNNEITVGVLTGPNHVGLRIKVCVTAEEAVLIADAGLQFVFDQPIEVSSTALSIMLCDHVLPALMPLLVGWMINEVNQFELPVTVPFTEIYPDLQFQIRGVVARLDAEAQSAEKA